MEWTGMRQGPGRGFSSAAKAELWDRWQRGESLKAIGRAFDKPSSSIYFQLARQELDRAQIATLLVDLGRFCPPDRMRAKQCGVQSC